MVARKVEDDEIIESRKIKGYLREKHRITAKKIGENHRITASERVGKHELLRIAS